MGPKPWGWFPKIDENDQNEVPKMVVFKMITIENDMKLNKNHRKYEIWDPNPGGGSL